MISCPLKSNPKYKEMSSVLGDSLATTAWVLNEGNPIELTSTGKKSKLFSDIEKKTGDRNQAIKLKGDLFSNDYRLAKGDWTNSSKEPSYREAVSYSKNAPLMAESIFTKENDQKLARGLEDFVSGVGISFKAVSNMKERYGFNAIAVADLTNGVIAYSNDLITIEDLHEEVGHFALEGLGFKNPTVARALELIDQTEIWSENVEHYKKIYNGDMQKVRVEIAGKLLGEALLTNNTERLEAENNANSSIFGRLLNLFNSIIAQVKSMFTGTPQKTVDQIIIDSYGPMAKDILAGNVTSESIERIRKSANFYASSNPLLTDPYAKGILEEGMRAQALTTRRMYSESIDDSNIADKLSIKQRALQRANVEGRTFDGINLLVGSAVESTGAILDKLRLIPETINEGNVEGVVRLLNSARKSSDVYAPVLKKLEASIVTSPTSDADTKRVSDQIKEIISNEAAIQGVIEKHQFLAIAVKLKDAYASNKEMTSEAFQELLKISEGDINMMSLWLNNAASQGDDIINIFDSYIKDHIAQNAIDIRPDIDALYSAEEKLRNAGFQNDFIYERDENGVPTGNLISQYKLNDYKSDLYEFTDALIRDNKKNFPAGFSIKEKSGITNIIAEFQNAEMNDSKGNEYSKAYKENILQPLVRYYQQNLSIPDSFTEFLDMDNISSMESFVLNVYRNISTNKSKEGKKILLADKYKGPELDSIFSEAEMEYYDIYSNLLEKYNGRLGKHGLGTLVPQIEKDMWENIDEQGVIKGVKKGVQDLGSRLNRDENRVSTTLINEKGEALNLIPTYYTNRLADMNDLSTDASSGLSAFIFRASENFVKRDIINEVELVDALLKVRHIKSGEKHPSGILSKYPILGKVAPTKAETGGNASKSFSYLLEKTFYGKTRNELEVKIPGTNKMLRIDKALDGLGAYTAINALAFNIYAGIANPLIGSMMMTQETMAGEHWNRENMMKASKIYAGGIMGVIGDMGSLTSNSKMRLYMEYTDALQDYDTEYSHANAKRSRLGRMMNQSALFFMNHAGEHALHGVAAIAMGEDIGLTKNGEKIGLYDAMEVSGTTLVISEGVLNKDGSKFTTKDLAKFNKRLAHVNQRLHGIYNNADKPLIQQHVVGGLMMMFRKFIVPGLVRRYHSKKHDYIHGYDTEGYYRTTTKFLYRLVVETNGVKLGLTEEWGALSRHEKANVVRAVTGAISTGTMMLLSSVALALAEGGDDDDWALNVAAYQARRLEFDLLFFNPLNIDEAMQIVSSPSATLDQVDRVYKAGRSISRTVLSILPGVDDELMQTGEYKDWRKGAVYGLRTLPFYRTYEGLITPEKKLGWLQNQ